MWLMLDVFLPNVLNRAHRHESATYHRHRVPADDHDRDQGKHQTNDMAQTSLPGEHLVHQVRVRNSRHHQ